MTLEEDLTSLNEWHFFEEFVYSSTTFRPEPRQEVELADNIVWIGELVLAFQLKERQPSGTTTGEVERRWFERKVLGVATRQVRDTAKFLRENERITLKNRRGHEFELVPRSISQLHTLVVYLPRPELPEECRRIKHHMSETVGFIHVVSGNDYLGIVRTLLTPAEVADYLRFRENIVAAHPDASLRVPEAALVAQYISGGPAGVPSEDFLPLLSALEHEEEEWDMSGIIKRFPERTTTVSRPTDYYYVVRELALLKRSELREFKKRFVLAREKAKADEFARPYRMAIPRTGCGFVVIPVTSELKDKRITALSNLTLGHKYEQKLQKCIGVVIADDDPPWFLADWCYVEHAWEPDPEMEQWLKDANPFRAVRQSELPGYTFSKDSIADK